MYYPRLMASDNSSLQFSQPQPGRPLEATKFSVTCADDWVLRGEWRAPAAPLAVVVLGHAMMVDRRTLDRPPGKGLASYLVEQGFAVVIADLRGHGESGPRAEEGGNWTYDDLVTQDVPALIEFARVTFPGLPLFVVGHSLFGQTALGYLARHPDAPVDRLVMFGPNAAMPEWKLRPRMMWRKGLLIEFMHLVTRFYGYFPARRWNLGTDNEARGYVDDFRRLWRERHWRGRDGFSYLEHLPHVRTPMLALVGAADRLLSPPADVTDLIARVPGAEVRVVGEHTGHPHDPGHMSLVLDAAHQPAWEVAVEFLRGGLVGR